MNRNELAELCKQRRITLKFTQKILGDLIGLPKARISEFEGNKSNLQCDTLLKLLQVLKLEITEKNN